MTKNMENMFLSYYIPDWTFSKIVAVAVGDRYTARAKANGTVEASAHVDRYAFRQEEFKASCEVSGWKLLNNIDTIEAERRASETTRKAKIESLTNEKDRLGAELADLKGLFTGKRRREIEERLEIIDAELKNLG